MPYSGDHISVSNRGPTFAWLKARLLVCLEKRIRNGEWTVRALAKRSGISQPHLHNVLKGHRDLSAATADRLLAAAGLTILDLLEPEEDAGS